MNVLNRNHRNTVEFVAEENVGPGLRPLNDELATVGENTDANYDGSAQNEGVVRGARDLEPIGKKVEFAAIASRMASQITSSDRKESFERSRRMDCTSETFG